MSISKRFLSGLIVILMVTALILPMPRASAASDLADFNVLVYMIGSDLESVDASASKDLEEMLKGAESFGDNINLLVYAGGTKKWHNDLFKSGKNSCVRIDSEGAELLYSEQAKDMTDAYTLRDFLNFCHCNYPAKRNLLLLWDHGGGVRGFGMDELAGHEEAMSSMSLAGALMDIGIEYDIIGFDACMMAGLETASAIADYAKYLVASEELEPTCGWSYESWLTELGKNPDIDTLDLCKLIADSYMESCDKLSKDVIRTMSVTDLKKLIELLPSAMSGFANELLNNFQSGSFNISKVQKALLNQLYKACGADSLDAIELAQNIGGEKAKQFANALRESIVYNRKYPETLEDNGLSIFVPVKQTNIQWVDVTDTDQLKALGVVDCYIDWISCITKYLNVTKAAAKGGRTLRDAIEGVENTQFDLSVMDMVSENRLDVSDCYIEHSADGIPQLIMSEEKKELVLLIYQSVYGIDADSLGEYGHLMYTADDFPIEASEFYDTMSSCWLHINGSICPFYMTDRSVLSSGQVIMYGYTPMWRNERYGVMYLNVVYDADGNQFFVEPTSYQSIGLDGDDAQYDRIRAISEMSPEDKLFFYRSALDKNGELTAEPMTDTMSWGDGLNFEWKAAQMDEYIEVRYYLMDLYGNLHELQVRNDV